MRLRRAEQELEYDLYVRANHTYPAPPPSRLWVQLEGFWSWLRQLGERLALGDDSVLVYPRSLASGNRRV